MSGGRKVPQGAFQLNKELFNSTGVSYSVAKRRMLVFEDCDIQVFEGTIFTLCPSLSPLTEISSVFWYIWVSATHQSSQALTCKELGLYQ